MKWKRHLLVIIASLFSFNVYGSPMDTIPPQKSLSIIQYVNGGSERGYIISINDSTIQFIKKKYWNNELYTQSQIIPAENIKGIVQKATSDISVVEGMLGGALAGIILGFSIGLKDCDDPANDCSFWDTLFSTKSF